MAKRKAPESEGQGVVTIRRRSSRHKTSDRENQAIDVGKQEPSDTIEGKALPKGAKKATAKTKGMKGDVKALTEPTLSRKEDDKLANGDESKSQRYWLLKAEPESRVENEHDVKFSIDDLAFKTAPEPWDGIRAYPARNNLRSMKKGDLAFFYHSNCKTPSIVGIMEIVKEHSPDLSAQDPKAAYYDPKDTDPANPKWSVVHVEFRRKFKEPITLKELREYALERKGLENMQMLKQSRLSVSAVTKGEWDFLMSAVEEKEKNEGLPS